MASGQRGGHSGPALPSALGVRAAAHPSATPACLLTVGSPDYSCVAMLGTNSGTPVICGRFPWAGCGVEERYGAREFQGPEL